MKKILAILMLAITLTACGTEEAADDSTILNKTTETTEDVLVPYEPITAEDAKKLMDTESDYIIVDARTAEEFAEGHIPGAILIPEYEIADRARAELPDKDQLILVYCRSGRRSKIASQALTDLGYTNVKEFGGIIDWPYDVVRD
ncbi:MAG: rhodanese-like domain-containing protein [Clostridia bacterium]|nr:rhodanese-like domain-containing protein [Clostridia bacterium]